MPGKVQHRSRVLVLLLLQYTGKCDYLKLPATKADLGAHGTSGKDKGNYQIQTGTLVLSLTDSFQIQTLVCSTKLTHNGKI